MIMEVLLLGEGILLEIELETLPLFQGANPFCKGNHGRGCQKDSWMAAGHRNWKRFEVPP